MARVFVKNPSVAREVKRVLRKLRVPFETERVPGSRRKKRNPKRRSTAKRKRAKSRARRRKK